MLLEPLRMDSLKSITLRGGRNNLDNIENSLD